MTLFESDLLSFYGPTEYNSQSLNETNLINETSEKCCHKLVNA